ncbi:hypothetical protein [Rhizorhabdus wittichii]|uniref:hypothetical protein n=1 Tax=Rhizorhabdus wittichii TaxID=160791 RepID=UPI0002FABF51|nr:hypothetical protein [Rhizorhabdus wittichii]
MTPFFSRTGTKRNLDAARAAGWGILVSAAGVWRDEGFPLIGADNGQWAERDNPGPFKAERFERFVDWLGDRAQWLVLPDIVCGGLESLDLSLGWLDRLRGHSAVLLIAVQNGMTPAMIAPFLGPRVGLFVGGDTAWKEETMTHWGQLAADAGCYCHVGRVNTIRRIRLAAIAGVHSIDGTSVTRFASTLPPLDFAARQPDMAPAWRPANERTPEGFARRCREIVATMPGHAAHRALDLLTNDILRDLGFGAGIEIFEAAVRDWHRRGQPYPIPTEPHWIDCERALAGMERRR